MITNTDRSGAFGGSDASMVIAKNRNTKTWKSWWSVKMGDMEPEFKGSSYTDAGNKYEHPILRSINEKMRLDRQIFVEKLLLRVNYDGDLNGTIYEVKTHKSEKDFEISRPYWRQAQVEMFAYQEKFNDFKRLYIVSYPLFPDEYYKDWDEVEVDFSRIKFHEIKYDKHFIKDEYLPCLKELSRALKKGRWPG